MKASRLVVVFECFRDCKLGAGCKSSATFFMGASMLSFCIPLAEMPLAMTSVSFFVFAGE